MLGAFYPAKVGAKILLMGASTNWVGAKKSFMGAYLNRVGAFFWRGVQICTHFAPEGVWSGKKGLFGVASVVLSERRQKTI